MGLFTEYVVEYVREEETVEGHQADIREKVENDLYNEYNVDVQLQEFIDEDEEEVYMFVHSDTWEDSDDEEMDKISDLGLDEYQEECTRAIEKLLDCSFALVREWKHPNR